MNITTNVTGDSEADNETTEQVPGAQSMSFKRYVH